MKMVSYDSAAQSYYVRRGTDTERLHPDVAAQLRETVDRGQNERVFLNVDKESWPKFREYLAADPERAKDFGREGGKPFIKPHRTPDGVEAFLDPAHFTSNEALSIKKDYVRGVPKEILKEMNVNLAGKSPHEVAFVEAGKSAEKVAPILNYPEKMGRPEFRTRAGVR
jgi:general stress protein YciG